MIMKWVTYQRGLAEGRRFYTGYSAVRGAIHPMRRGSTFSTLQGAGVKRRSPMWGSTTARTQTTAPKKTNTLFAAKNRRFFSEFIFPFQPISLHFFSPFIPFPVCLLLLLRPGPPTLSFLLRRARGGNWLCWPLLLLELYAAKWKKQESYLMSLQCKKNTTHFTQSKEIWRCISSTRSKTDWLFVRKERKKKPPAA